MKSPIQPKIISRPNPIPAFQATANSRLSVLLSCAYLIALPSLFGANVQHFENFANGVVTNSDSYKNFWQLETPSGFTITEDSNLIHFDVTGSGAKYGAIRSTKNADHFNFFQSKKVMYVKTIHKTGNAAGFFRFEVTGTIEKYSSAEDAIWVEVNGKNVKLTIKQNNTQKVQRSIVLEKNCIMVILELNNANYVLKSYCQVKRPDDKKGKVNQIRIQTMAGTHGLSQGQWGTSGNTYIGLSAERTANTGTFHYDLAEFRAVERSKMTALGSYYDVYPKGPNARPPGVLASDPFFKKGFLNVRNAPYNAIGDGSVDDTLAIQNAIIDAYEYDKATYIPSGTYLVFRKITGVQKANIRKAPNVGGKNWDQNNYDGTGTFTWINGQGYQRYIIFGDETNRPVIKLADNTPGFQSTANNYDKANPKQKEIIQIWGQPNGAEVVFRNSLSEKPQDSSPAILYDTVIRDLRIDMGKNNPGAIGFSVAGAQGCNISNIHVTGSGFACFRELGGVGGSNISLSGNGCRYGIYISAIISAHPHIVGLTLTNQTVASVYHKYASPVTITGAKFVKKNGPFIKLQNGHVSGCHVSVIDAIAEFTNTGAGKAFDNANTKNLHLHNVYIKNANQVTNGQAAKGNGWVHVKEFGYNDEKSHGILNGTKKTNAGIVFADVQTNNVSAPTKDYVLKHAPAPGDIPGAKSIVGTNGNNGVAFNATKAPPAVNNGDYHARFQHAIDNHSIVWIPMASYKISKPLVLRDGTKLIGLGGGQCFIDTHGNWNKPVNTAMIHAPEGTNPVISDFKIRINAPKGVAAILWEGGSRSISQSIKVSTLANNNKFSKPVHIWKYIGQGGGRHYGNLITAGAYSNHTNYRLIQANGTTTPLGIYGINSETGKKPHHEIINAENVYIMHIKNEGGGQVLKIKNSNNILVAGQSGNYTPSGTNDGAVLVENSNNITIANVSPLRNGGSGFAVKIDGVRIENAKVGSFVKKGNTPVILPFTGGNGGIQPPVITPITDKAMNEGTSLTVLVEASGENITFDVSNAPATLWWSFNEETRELKLNPWYKAGLPGGKDLIFTITATNAGGSYTETFTLTVNDVNRQPAIVQITDQVVDEDCIGVIHLNATDPDGNPLNFSATGIPGFGSLTDNGDGTGMLLFHPKEGDAKTYAITITVDDGQASNNTAETSFDLTVQ